MQFQGSTLRTTATEENAEEREGQYTVGSPAREVCRRGGHRSSLDREVVSGLAFAIPARRPVFSGQCGQSKPTSPSVGGVSDP